MVKRHIACFLHGLVNIIDDNYIIPRQMNYFKESTSNRFRSKPFYEKQLQKSHMYPYICNSEYVK